MSYAFVMVAVATVVFAGCMVVYRVLVEQDFDPEWRRLGMGASTVYYASALMDVFWFAPWMAPVPVALSAWCAWRFVDRYNRAVNSPPVAPANRPRFGAIRRGGEKIPLVFHATDDPLIFRPLRADTEEVVDVEDGDLLAVDRFDHRAGQKIAFPSVNWPPCC